MIVYVAATITVQPQSQTNNQGSNVTFTVTATGSSPLNYQWKKDGTNLSGATLNGYSIINLQPSDSGTYSVSVGNPAGTANSAPAILSVRVKPAFITQPQSQTVFVGQTANFSTSASGTAPFGYAWFKGGQAIVGATNSSYTIPNAQGGVNAGSYSVMVSNAAGSVTSSNAQLSFVGAPVITVQPQSRSVGEGSNTTFSVTAGGNTPLFFQWRKDGTNIPFATSATYSITAVQTNHAGSYSVIITNNAGSVTSTNASLTVLAFPPTILAQPQSRSAGVGGSTTFSVTAAGASPLRYEWRKDGVPLSATNATLTLTNLAFQDAGAYSVLITNNYGGITSSIANLVIGISPTFSSQPFSQTSSFGSTVVFSAEISGSSPIYLQWYRDGAALASATNSSLTIPDARPLHIGAYSVSASNTFGSILSSNALLNLSGYAFEDWRGLAAFYPFNGNAVDESGSGNDGVISGATLVSDRFGALSAYFFNGSDNVIDFERVPITQTDNWSVSAWINPAALPQTGVAVSVGFDNGINGDGFGFGFDGASIWKGIFSGVTWMGSGYSPISNQWFHSIMIREAGVTKFFINGVQTGFSYTVNPAPPTRFSIGSQTGARFFNGAVDDVRIYGRALSSNEIQRLYSIEADLPVITQAPRNLVVWQGATAVFSVIATAQHSAVTYQWQKNGIAISNANTSTLTIQNVQPNATGVYTVILGNALGAVTTPAAALSVVIPRVDSPAITQGKMSFQILGSPGSQVIIEASEDLQTWAQILTTNLSSGTNIIIDSTGLNFPQRFYRFRY